MSIRLGKLSGVLRRSISWPQPVSNDEDADETHHGFDAAAARRGAWSPGSDDETPARDEETPARDDDAPVMRRSTSWPEGLDRLVNRVGSQLRGASPVVLGPRAPSPAAKDSPRKMRAAGSVGGYVEPQPQQRGPRGPGGCIVPKAKQGLPSEGNLKEKVSPLAPTGVVSPPLSSCSSPQGPGAGAFAHAARTREAKPAPNVPAPPLRKCKSDDNLSWLECNLNKIPERQGIVKRSGQGRNAFRRLRWAETLEQVQVYVCEPWPAEDLWTGRPSRKTHWHGGETGETGGVTGGMEGHEHGRQGDVDTAVSVVS